jgi:rod shape-determining protein MreC
MRVSSALKIFQIASFSRYVLVLVAFTVVTLALFVADVNQVPLVQTTRMKIMDGLSPIFSAAQSVNQTTSGVMEKISDFFSAYQQLDELREENSKLTRWKAVALSLLSENKSLRNQINVVPESFRPVVTARVLTFPSNPGVHRIIIQAGTAQNVAEGQIVVTPKGVIGRILKCGTYASEVLLITDGYSRIPVTIEPIHQQAILAGTQNNYLEFDHLERNFDLTSGMHVFTSGKGGIFPPGLYLGMTHQSGDQVIIEPVMDWKDLDYVQILSQPQLSVDD